MPAPQQNGASRLNPEFKARWVAALRSGEYEQQREGQLYYGGAYCCLGVARKIDGKRGSHDDFGTYPRPAHCKAWGLTNKEMNKLARMNDGASGQRKHTFPEIADYIEANL